MRTVIVRSENPAVVRIQNLEPRRILAGRGSILVGEHGFKGHVRSSIHVDRFGERAPMHWVKRVEDRVHRAGLQFTECRERALAEFEWIVAARHVVAHDVRIGANGIDAHRLESRFARHALLQKILRVSKGVGKFQTLPINQEPGQHAFDQVQSLATVHSALFVMAHKAREIDTAADAVLRQEHRVVVD